MDISINEENFSKTNLFSFGIGAFYGMKAGSERSLEDVIASPLLFFGAWEIMFGAEKFQNRAVNMITNGMDLFAGAALSMAYRENNLSLGASALVISGIVAPLIREYNYSQ